MCGFTGELRTDGHQPDIAAVARMADAVSPRGPDAAGTWSNSWAALGHRRLSIIDTSPLGSQPMVDPELGLSIAFNGCIYNHHELRRELESHGYRFFSTSDTEVLLKGYHRWGTDVVHRLQGMFALCIVERDRGRAVLARDPLGIKPLYLARRAGRLRFGSTLPALVAGGDVDTDIDVVALHHQLTLHGIVPAPRTLLRGVTKLPPATILVVDRAGTEAETTYWDPSFTRARPDVADWDEAVLAALRTAVERRWACSCPVGSTPA